MRGFPRSRAGAICLALAAALLGGWAAVKGPPPFLEGPEMAVFDRCQEWARVPDVPEKIIVVLGQERSLRAVGAWPWPRRLHAHLLGRLNLARVISLDILFSETSNPEDDALLAAVTRQSGRVLAASQLVLDETSRQPVTVLAPYPDLAEAAAELALVNVDPAPDGLYRDYRLVWPMGKDLVPTMALALYLAAGRPRPALTPEADGGYRLELTSGPVRLEPDLTFKIHHPSSVGGQPPVIYEYIDVLEGRVPPEEFKDALVLVGINAPGAADQFAIGRGLILPGTVYIAHALQTLLHGWIPATAPPWARGLSGALLTLAGGLIGFLPRRRGGVWLFPLLALWLGLSLWLFWERSLWLPPLTAMLTAVLAFSLAAGLRLRLLTEDWHVQRLSIDSLLFNSRQDFDPSQTTFAGYLRDNWAEVEKWSGVALIEPWAAADNPAVRELMAASPADPDAAAGQPEASVAVDAAGRRRLLLALPDMPESQGRRYAVLAWRGRLSQETIRSVAALVLSSAIHFRALEENQARRELFMGVLKLIMGAVDAKDPFTAGHSERVAELARELAEKAGLPPEELENIYLGGLLHDVGKLGIPDRILNKPGYLDEEEMAVMRGHSALGGKLMSQIKLPAMVIQAIVEHHERFDGRGYPAGLTNLEWSRAGRILKIADVYDALISRRHYKAPLSLEQTYRILREGSGTDFDPELIRLLLTEPFTPPPGQAEELAALGLTPERAADDRRD